MWLGSIEVKCYVVEQFNLIVVVASALMVIKVNNYLSDKILTQLIARCQVFLADAFIGGH